MKTRRKKLLLFNLLFLFINDGFGQAPQVVIGPLIKGPSRTAITGILATTPQGYLVKRDRSTWTAKPPIIESYDKSFNILGAHELSWEEEGKEVRVGGIVQTAHHSYVTGGVRVKDTKEYKTFFRKLDKSNGQYAGDPQEIEALNFSRVGSRVYWYGIGLQNDPLFRSAYGLSPDSTKMLMYGVGRQKSDENESCAFAVYHEDQLVKLFETEYTFPYDSKLMKVETINVGNDGRVYVMGLLYNERVKAMVKGEPNYKYVVFVFEPGVSEPSEYVIDLGDKFITDMTMRLAENGDLICAGFISDKGKASINGITFFTVDGRNGSIKSRSVKEFGVEFMEQFLSERKVRKGKELYAYDLRNMVVQPDGSTILLAEQYYYRVVTTTDARGNMVSNVYYYYNHIIVTHISPEGEIQWCIKVPKVQVTMNDGGYYSSFATGMKGDKIYLIFNDNPKNFTAKPGTKRTYPFNGKKSIAVLVEVDAEGNLKKDPLFSNKEAGILMVPKACSMINPDELLIYGHLKSKYRLGKLILSAQ